MTRRVRMKAAPRVVPVLTPELLSEAPERANLEVLRAVLHITVLSLVTANPELLNDDWPAMPERGHLTFVRAAHKILMRSYALQTDLERYVDLLNCQREADRNRPGDDLPF